MRINAKQKLYLAAGMCLAAGIAAGAVADRAWAGNRSPAEPDPQEISARTMSSPSPSPSPSPTMEPVDNAIWEDGVVNILFIGTDELYGEEDMGRGDATMLCSLNKKKGSIKLVSFERSIGVPWPEHGDVMLTNSYAHGGAELTCRDISRCFRVDIDGYVQMDFSGFSQVIDLLGGVDLTLTKEEAQALTEDCYYEVWFSEGENHMNGEAALRYCRLRRIDDNWQRIERQRALIRAVMERGKSLRLTQLRELLPLISERLSTDLSRAEMLALLVTAPRFFREELQQMTVPDRNRVWTYHSGEETVTGCDFGAESLRLQQFLYENENT